MYFRIDLNVKLVFRTSQEVHNPRTDFGATLPGRLQFGQDAARRWAAALLGRTVVVGEARRSGSFDGLDHSRHNHDRCTRRMAPANAASSELVPVPRWTVLRHHRLSSSGCRGLLADGGI